MVDLGVQDNKITYTTQIATIAERLIALYTNALGMLHNIPTLEREIMESLIWTHTPSLSSVHPQVREFSQKILIVVDLQSFSDFS